MTRVGARAVTRVADARGRSHASGVMQDVAPTSTGAAGRPGSCRGRSRYRPVPGLVVLDAAAAREALRQAALEDAVRQRAAERQPPSIDTARTARRAAAASDFVQTGPVDDAAIEAHVRRLLASRAG